MSSMCANTLVNVIILNLFPTLKIICSDNARFKGELKTRYPFSLASFATDDGSTPTLLFFGVIWS